MIYKIYYGLPILLILFSIDSLNSQVKGIVVDSLDNSALEYATVALYKKSDKTLSSGVITDTEGKFQIEGLASGSYYAEISFLGYKTHLIDTIIIEPDISTIDLGIIPLQLGNQLNEVVLRSERSTMINKIDRQVFDGTAFKTSKGGNAADVLKNFPSVNLDGQGNLSIRGVNGFVILLNGKPIQGDAMMIINQIPANALDRVELVTAPSSKYDPEGKAGLINIITLKGAADGAFTQVNIRGGMPSIQSYGNDRPAQRYGADVTYNLRSDTWNFSLGASYQRNDISGRREGDVFTIINDTLTRFPSDGERSFDEVNYSGRISLDFTPDTTTIFSLGFFAGKRSKDRLADIVYYDNYAIDTDNENDRIYTFQYFNHNLRVRKSDFVLGSLDYSHDFRNQSSLSASFLYEYTLLGGPTENDNLGFPDRSTVYQREYNSNDNPLNGIRIQTDYRLKPLSIGSIEMGYQYRHLDHKGDFIYERLNDASGDYNLVPEFSSEVDLKRSIHSSYLQLTGKKEKWSYAIGSRLEYLKRDFDLKDKGGTIDTTYTYDYTKIFPSGSITYNLTDRSHLNLAYSKRVQRTTTFKMNPFPEREHSETLEQGDPTLLPEFIDLVELGYHHKLKKGSSIYATGYLRTTQNVVNRVNTIYNDTILNRIYSNVGKGHSLGIDFGAQIKMSDDWSNFLGANIYNYRINGTFNNRPVNTDATVFSINATSTYKFWQNASLQFTFNFLSDRNTAQGSDSQFYSPHLALQKSFFDEQLLATIQWQNIDLGLLNSNEQRITTFMP